MTASVQTGVAHGSLTLNANGSFSYTPTPGYSGPDTFTYRASNSVGPSGIATVAITVGGAVVPPWVLLANWGDVRDDLCADLMNYDAANHPNGKEAFAAWAAGGVCPYTGCRVARSANFAERKGCYRPERPLQSALQLMDRLLVEKTKTVLS